jgi:hypothetical protein
MATRNYTQPKFRYEEWQPQYEAALLELDPKKLRQRIEEAETAIFNRLQCLSSSSYELERQAIDDALAALRVLTQVAAEES